MSNMCKKNVLRTHMRSTTYVRMCSRTHANMRCTHGAWHEGAGGLREGYGAKLNKCKNSQKEKIMMQKQISWSRDVIQNPTTKQRQVVVIFPFLAILVKRHPSHSILQVRIHPKRSSLEVVLRLVRLIDPIWLYYVSV